MDWSLVKRTPKYNPFMFEVARHIDGLAKWEFAKRAGLTTKKYSDIEGGNIEPTEEEFNKIVTSQTHFIKSFFEQWWETELDISGPFAKNVPIDYYKYKIFRDLNPPPLKAIK